MDGALRRLLVLQLRGGLRYRLRQLANLRGAVFITIVAAIVWVLLVARTAPPNEYLAGAEAFSPERLREHLSVFLPLGLLSACLFTVFVAVGPAVHFSPHEINFLFAGPFRRHALIIYKFCSYFAGAVISAVIITLLIPPRTSTPIAAFAGTLLTLLFVQLSSAAIRTFVHAFGGDLLARIRRPDVLAVSAVLGVIVVYGIAAADANIIELLSAFRHSWPGTVLLAPFIVFARVFLATELFPDLAVWSAAAIVINLGLLAAIIALDGRITDRALAESSRLSNRWLRVRRGGSIWASNKTTGRSLRRSPVLGGLGPIVWRQAINAFRNSGRVIAVFLAIAALTGPLVTATGIQSTGSGTLGTLYFLVAFVMPRTLVCDFRGELGRIEHYKALPIAAWRICAAQLVVPVLVSTVILLVAIFSIVPFLDFTSAFILAGLAVYALPFNLLLYGLENLVFLLFPTKLVPVGRVDFDFLGRTLVDFILKTIIIFTTLGTARAAGMAAQRKTGEFVYSFGLTSWSVLAIAGLLTIPMLALAFQRFKVSETID